jgi:hypothetical protein
MDHVRAFLVQRAAGAVADFRMDLFEGFGRRRQGWRRGRDIGKE